MLPVARPLPSPELLWPGAAPAAVLEARAACMLASKRPALSVPRTYIVRHWHQHSGHCVALVRVMPLPVSCFYENTCAASQTVCCCMCIQTGAATPPHQHAQHATHRTFHALRLKAPNSSTHGMALGRLAS